jgi:lauroyl/myristoyl acyltransferase
MGNDADHMTMQMCVSPEGFSELEMRDQNDVIRALMSVYGNGNAVISLSDKDANPRIWTRMKNEVPLFGVANANGDIIWSAP